MRYSNISDLYKQVQRNSFKRAILNLSEKLGANATMDDYISDFAKSDAPQFKGRSKEQRKKMAIAAYLDKTGQTREEVNEELDEGFSSKEIKMAIGIASDPRYAKGNMTGAVNAIEKIKKGLSQEKQVAAVLKRQNEEVELDENFRKLAMKGMGTETKKGARVGLKTDYYLPSNGDKSFGKIMRVSSDGYEIEDEKTKKTHKFKFYDPMKAKQMKEVYDIGNDYAKHTLEVTPGQDKQDVDEMLGIAQKKNISMREALAKVWGVDEGKSPFQKKEEMKKDKPSKKTMTGKDATAVEIDPKI